VEANPWLAPASRPARASARGTLGVGIDQHYLAPTLVEGVRKEGREVVLALPPLRLAIVSTRIPGVTIAGYLVAGSAELSVRMCAVAHRVSGSARRARHPGEDLAPHGGWHESNGATSPVRRWTVDNLRALLPGEQQRLSEGRTDDRSVCPSSPSPKGRLGQRGGQTQTTRRGGYHDVTVSAHVAANADVFPQS